VAIFGTLRDVDLSSLQQEAAYGKWLDHITIVCDAEGVPA
jgi:hypothetical protein